jgi:hypothetical protein
MESISLKKKKKNHNHPCTYLSYLYIYIYIMKFTGKLNNFFHQKEQELLLVAWTIGCEYKIINNILLIDTANPFCIIFITVTCYLSS